MKKLDFSLLNRERTNDEHNEEPERHNSNVIYTPRGTIVKSNIPNSRLYRPKRAHSPIGMNDSNFDLNASMLSHRSMNSFSINDYSVVAGTSHEEGEMNEELMEEYKEEELLILRGHFSDGDELFLIHHNAKRYISVNPERLYLRFQQPGTFNRYSSMVNLKCDLNEKERKIFYYEIQVLRCKKAAKIVAGFCHRDAYQFLVPGVDENSVGYHSDTGKVRHGSSEYSCLDFGQGDFIGCGIMLPSKQVFFTHNGKFCGKSFILDHNSTKKTSKEPPIFEYIPQVGIVKYSSDTGGMQLGEVQMREERGRPLDERIIRRYTRETTSLTIENDHTVSPVIYSNSPAVLEVNIGQYPFTVDIDSLDRESYFELSTSSSMRNTVSSVTEIDEVQKSILSAVAKGKFDMLESLLREYSDDINLIETSDNSFLFHVAIMNKSEFAPEILQMLRQHGADPNRSSLTHGPPLHTAVRFNNIEAVICLLELGADVHAQWNGKTAINTVYKIENICSPKSSYDDSRIIELINIIRGAGGVLDIHSASFIGDIQAVRDSIDIHREYIDSQDERRRTPLHIATHRGHIDLIQFLLSRGANLDVDMLIPSPFIVAALNYDTDIIKSMVYSRADVNNGFMKHHVLEILMEHQRQDLEEEEDRKLKYLTMKTLCELGSDPCQYYNRPSVSAHIFKCALLLSIEKRDWESFELFCKYGRTIKSIRGPNDESLLHIIAGQPCPRRHILLDMAKQLMDIVAIDIDHDTTENGNTIAHIASANGNNHFLTLLIKNGACVNDWNLDGMSPLMMAIMNNHPDTARLLMKKGGAKPNSSNSKGETVLHLLYSDTRTLPSKRRCLYETGDYPILDSVTRLALGEFCIEKLGVNPNIRDKRGNTAKQYAALNGIIREYPFKTRHKVL